MIAAATALHALHLLATVVVTGFMAVVQWTVVPAQDLLDGPAYAAFEKRMNVVLQPLTPTLFVTGIAAGAAVAALAFSAGSTIGWLHLATALGLVAMTVSTLLINAPINTAINRWDQTHPPSDWQHQRDTWERGHAIRVAIGIPTLMVAVAAAVL